MALGNTTKDFIRDEIEAQLALAIDKFSPHGARRLTHFIREWGLAGTVVMAFLALLAFGAGAVYQATARVEKQTAFQTRTESRLDNIEKILRNIQGQLATQSVINHASLPLPDFKATLPDLSSAIDAAKQQKIKVPAQVMGDLQQKLRASTDAPDFWSTAAQFISYRSQDAVRDFESLARPDLPNCTDHDPTPMDLIVKGDVEKNGRANDILMLPDTSSETGKGNQLVTARYEDCRFILDSPEESAKVPFLRDGRSVALTFKHCQIVYRGGPIRLLTPNPRPTALSSRGETRSDVYVFVGQRVHFENCLFLFVVNSRPPAEGQWLTTQLLVQNGPDFSVTSQKPVTPS